MTERALEIRAGILEHARPAALRGDHDGDGLLQRVPARFHRQHDPLDQNS